jgi:hypothetical protein
MVVGCGGETGPEVYPVAGTVLYRGEPVEGAVVAFQSENATKLATGTTDPQGRFELSTYEPGDGAVPGKHKVTVTKIAQAGGGSSGTASMEEAYQSTQAPAEAKNQLPSKYEVAGTSPLEFTVSADDTNDFKIELTD